ncbi:MAG TPA: hypothetical protein VHT51_10235 [Micropepsaceae bacterium]|nr:hypothetical protein [Micropepsaceae bacterium]
MRTVAGTATQAQNRQFLINIAADYESLANRAELLAALNERVARTDSRDAGSPEPEGAENVLEQDSKSLTLDDKVQLYRDMAADASVLGGAAEGWTRKGWVALSESWTKLADDLEDELKHRWWRKVDAAK